MLALAWFLGANPLRPMAFSEGPQIALKIEIGADANKTELTSINRYQNFLYGHATLAFATFVGGRDSEDINSRRGHPPTQHAPSTRRWPAIFTDDVELPIEVFLRRLAAIFPVFEKGSIRKDFDEMRPQPAG